MKKKLLIGLVILLLAGGGFWFLKDNKESTQTVEKKTEAAIVAEEQEPTPLTKEQLSDKFQVLVAETRSALPTLDSIKKLEEEDVHQTPVVIHKAGQALGRILTFRKEHPEFDKEAMEFYQLCATNNGAPISIRALCLYNITDIDAKADLKPYPKSVVELMKKLK